MNFGLNTKLRRKLGIIFLNNENKNTIYKSLWDVAKAMQRKIHSIMFFIVLNA